MHQPKSDASLETQPLLDEPCATKAKQPWEAPALDALPLSETYNAPNFNSDGMSGS